VAAEDGLTVGLDYDAEPRTVDLPDALRSALEADAAAAAAFEKLAYTRKKEFIQWVTGAKRADTQSRRMEQALGCCGPGQNGADGSGGLALPQRVGDPVVELPLFLEGQDAQEQLFMDVLELAAPLDSLRIQRLWNERLELLGGIHC